jgi:DNA-binding response OmpR family regulator
MATILVVDDNRPLREFVGVTLRAAGYQVALLPDGEGVAEYVAQHGPRLVVMDINMPTISGLEALRHLRERGSSVPVIMLTACDEDQDKLNAFEAGADDYLVKPFNARELVARIAAVLRRVSPEPAEPTPEQVLHIGELRLRPREHTVLVGEKAVNLTRTEYALLLTLAQGAGRVFTPAELLSRVWGPEYRDQAEILRTNMYRLRQKLEADPKQPRHLRTRPGVGYYLAA